MIESNYNIIQVCKILTAAKIRMSYPGSPFTTGEVLYENLHDPCCYCRLADTERKDQSKFDQVSKHVIIAHPAIFDPIYKIVSAKVRMGCPSMDIHISSTTGIQFGEITVPIESIKSLLQKYFTESLVFGFRELNPKVDSIFLGKSKFSKGDISEIIKIYNQLEKQN